MRKTLASLGTPRGLVVAALLLAMAVLPVIAQVFDQRYLLSVGTRIVIWSSVVWSKRFCTGREMGFPGSNCATCVSSKRTGL